MKYCEGSEAEINTFLVNLERKSDVLVISLVSIFALATMIGSYVIFFMRKAHQRPLFVTV